MKLRIRHSVREAVPIAMIHDEVAVIVDTSNNPFVPGIPATHEAETRLDLLGLQEIE